MKDLPENLKKIGAAMIEFLDGPMDGPAENRMLKAIGAGIGLRPVREAYEAAAAAKLAAKESGANPAEIRAAMEGAIGAALGAPLAGKGGM